MNIINQLLEHIDNKQSFYYIFGNGKRVDSVYNTARGYWHSAQNPRNGFNSSMLKLVVGDTIKKERFSHMMEYGVIPDQVNNVFMPEFERVLFSKTPDRGLYITKDANKGGDHWIAMSTLTGLIVVEEFNNRHHTFDFLLKEAANANCEN